MGRARLSVLVVALAAALAGGCGGSSSDGDGPRAVPAPQLDPPQAAEPARAPAPEAEPAGRVVRLGGPVEGLVADPRTGLLAGARQDRPELVVAALPSGEVRERVPLPAAPRHLELTEPGGSVLVPAEEADELATVDPASGEITRRDAGDHPHDAAALGGEAYTADEFGSTVTRIGGDSAPVDAQPGGIVAVGDALAVISVRAYTIELFDPETLRGGGSQAAGLGPTHAVADRQGRVYVTDTRGDALVVFATRPRLKFLARVPLEGSPYGIAVDESAGRLWVTLTARNELVELTTGERPERRRALPTVRQPNTVAVDGERGIVAVASATDDAVQLVETR